MGGPSECLKLSSSLGDPRRPARGERHGREEGQEGELKKLPKKLREDRRVSEAEFLVL